MKQAFPIDHAVPISKAIRAGDFVFTSAFGPWVFNPANLKYDEAGNVIDDVVNSECWLTDPRDFVAFNAIYKTYFKAAPPVRSIFPMRFMFTCKVEMKVVAYKPLTA